MRTDYYQLLGVEQGVSSAELKAAYRRQAKRYHPDLNVGNPAAEEKFKLIAEAYRTLGEPERRADYDAWLERQTRLSNAPELAAMAHARSRVRVSVRHAYERRAARGRGRQRRHSGGRVPRLFALRTKSDGGLLQFMLFYGVCLAVMVPWFIGYAGREVPGARSSAPMSQRLPGESDLPPDIQERELRNFHERIIRAAEAGEPWAQFRYGMMLYHGYQGLEQNRQEAMIWWQRAAAAGHTAAAHFLSEAERSASQPASEPQAEPEGGTPIN